MNSTGNEFNPVGTVTYKGRSVGLVFLANPCRNFKKRALLCARPKPK